MKMCCLAPVSHLLIYFVSAAVAVDSCHASSSASWRRFSPPSSFVNRHVSTIGSWSVAAYSHKQVIGRDPICASQHDMGLDLSGNGSSETVYDKGDQNLYSSDGE